MIKGFDIDSNWRLQALEDEDLRPLWDSPARDLLSQRYKFDADNPADREKLRRATLDLVAARKMPKKKGRG